MSVRTFTLPDLGEGLTEAEIITWLVAAGDTVVVDQPIVEVETAKSVVEVPCPFAGTVHALHAEASTTLAVGSPLISVEDGVGGGAPEAADGGGSAAGPGAADGSDAAAAERPTGAAGAADAERTGAAGDADAAGESEDSGSGNVLVGYGTSGAAATRRTRRPRSRAGAAAADRAGSAAAAPTGAGASAGAAPGPAPSAASPSTPDAPREAPRVINPLVRRMARDHGVPLAAIEGTGAGGLIMRADVQAAIDGTPAPAGAAAAAATSAGSVAGAVVDAAPSGEVDQRTGLTVTDVERVSGIRKATAAAVSRSRREIPEATIWVDVDVTPLQELRAELSTGGEKAPGLLAFAARFVLAGLTRYPELARRFEDDGDGDQRIVSFEGVNLGFAAQTDRGLVVPSVRRADTMTARQLHAELRRLTDLARSGEATPQDLSGGTFTLNNYGVFGVDGSSAIINHPEAAILGMGRILERPWGVEGELKLRQIMQLSLVFDHRICDGGTAGGFIRFVADCFENPARMLADL